MSHPDHPCIHRRSFWSHCVSLYFQRILFFSLFDKTTTTTTTIIILLPSYQLHQLWVNFLPSSSKKLAVFYVCSWPEIKSLPNSLPSSVSCWFFFFFKFLFHLFICFVCFVNFLKESLVLKCLLLLQGLSLPLSTQASLVYGWQPCFLLYFQALAPPFWSAVTCGSFTLFYAWIFYR